MYNARYTIFLATTAFLTAEEHTQSCKNATTASLWMIAAPWLVSIVRQWWRRRIWALCHWQRWHRARLCTHHRRYGCWCGVWHGLCSSRIVWCSCRCHHGASICCVHGW
ncbi:hypothetical protein BDB00DRAFT_838989 [Zychaea mexicana]|uniref:uncharacterized protein n=1 Tax=Zychaea mexicana TaxID=64656 RepID=UPI0022FE7612|nr:uncharacterized protein BDB00DRAFT_838989 [Zychaea mexicana]KAI9490261.1 hypothetical protein BDB00DRAFT_838989 [Zychaea mexicana]